MPSFCKTFDWHCSQDLGFREEYEFNICRFAVGADGN